MILRDDQLARVCGGAYDASKSDGCTMSADGWWRSACVEHDREYYDGGPDKKGADRRLRDNMIKSDAPPLIAKIYQLGVGAGGVSWLPTPWRWGFGKDGKK